MSATPNELEYDFENVTVEEVQAEIAAALADPASYEQFRKDGDPTAKELAAALGAAPEQAIGVEQKKSGFGFIEVLVVTFATTFATEFAKALAPVAADMVKDVWKGIVYPRLLDKYGKKSLREKTK